MLTEGRKISIYKWRNKHTEEYLAYQRDYNTEYRLNNYEKELVRVRRYRLFNAESKRLRGILLDI
jgi:hypothetical protein